MISAFHPFIVSSFHSYIVGPTVSHSHCVATFVKRCLKMSIANHAEGLTRVVWSSQVPDKGRSLRGFRILFNITDDQLRRGDVKRLQINDVTRKIVFRNPHFIHQNIHSQMDPIAQLHRSSKSVDYTFNLIFISYS